MKLPIPGLDLVLSGLLRKPQICWLNPQFWELNEPATFGISYRGFHHFQSFEVLPWQWAPLGFWAMNCKQIYKIPFQHLQLRGNSMMSNQTNQCFQTPISHVYWYYMRSNQHWLVTCVSHVSHSTPEDCWECSPPTDFAAGSGNFVSMFPLVVSWCNAQCSLKKLRVVKVNIDDRSLEHAAGNSPTQSV